MNVSDGPIPQKTILALWSLSGCYFALGVASLSVIGLAAPMADGLGVSQASIAFLMTAFAVTYAIGAPSLQMLIGDWDRRLMLLMGLGGIAGGMILCAVAPSYEIVLAARVLMALGCCLIGPMSLALGASLVPPDRRGMALGIVFTGMTISTVIGIPLTAWLGSQIDWRVVMVLIGGLAAAIALLVWLVVPTGSRGQRTTPTDLMSVLSDRVLAPAISVTLFQMAGIFATYSLIGLFLSTTIGMSEDLLSPVLLIFGVGGVIGNVLATQLVGRFGPDRMIPASLIILAGIFALLGIWSPPVPIALGLLVIWAICGMMMMVPQQARLVSLRPQAQNLILALNASGLYVGMAGGSALAGIVSGRFGTGYLPLASCLMILAALAAFKLSYKRANTGAGCAPAE